MAPSCGQAGAWPAVHGPNVGHAASLHPCSPRVSGHACPEETLQKTCGAGGNDDDVPHTYSVIFFLGFWSEGPTLGVRRGGQRERGTSGRWQPSPARRGSAGAPRRAARYISPPPPQCRPHGSAPSGVLPLPRYSRAPPYLITSSARKRNAGDSVRSRAWAVVRLIISSNFMARSMGKSPGLAPFRILST